MDVERSHRLREEVPMRPHLPAEGAKLGFTYRPTSAKLGLTCRPTSRVGTHFRGQREEVLQADLVKMFGMSCFRNVETSLSRARGGLRQALGVHGCGWRGLPQTRVVSGKRPAADRAWQWNRHPGNASS